MSSVMICQWPPARCSRWAIANDLECLSAQQTGHSLGRWCHFAAGVQPDHQPLGQQLEGRPALLFRLLCTMQSTFDVSNTLTISDSVCWTGGRQALRRHRIGLLAFWWRRHVCTCGHVRHQARHAADRGGLNQQLQPPQLQAGVADCWTLRLCRPAELQQWRWPTAAAFSTGLLRPARTEPLEPGIRALSLEHVECSKCPT